MTIAGPLNTAPIVAQAVAGYFRGVDWRLICLGLLGCYVLPWLVVGTALFGFMKPNRDYAAWIGLAVLLFDFLGPPLVGGYFAARYARNRPQFHALLLALFGTGIYFLLGSSATVTGVSAVGTFYVACAALGAFLYLRRNEDPRRFS